MLAQHKEPQTNQNDRRGDVVAEHVAARALVEKDDERDGQTDGQDYVRRRGDQIGAAAIANAQQRISHLQVREGPDPKDTGRHQRRVGASEHKLRERLGEQNAGNQSQRRADQHESARRPHEVATSVVAACLVPIADECLSEAGTEQDADQDHQRQQCLCVAKLGRCERACVKRQCE